MVMTLAITPTLLMITPRARTMLLKIIIIKMNPGHFYAWFLLTI